MVLPRRFQQDAQRMGVEGGAIAPAAPSMPGTRVRSSAAIDQALGMLGPRRVAAQPQAQVQQPAPQEQQPQRIQGDALARFTGDTRPTGSGIGTLSPAEPLADIRDPFPRVGDAPIDAGGLGVGSGGIATDPFANLDTTDFDNLGRNVAPDAPVSVDDLANDAQGELYQALLDLLDGGGRDTDAEKAALEEQMITAQQQGLVDDRARFGAMGGAASGALAGLEADSLRQGALDRALAGAQIDAAGRQEDLARLSGATSIFGGLESTSGDSTLLDLALEALGEDDPDAGPLTEAETDRADVQDTLGGVVGQLGDDVRSFITGTDSFRDPIENPDGTFYDPVTKKTYAADGTFLRDGR